MVDKHNCTNSAINGNIIPQIQIQIQIVGSKHPIYTMRQCDFSWYRIPTKPWFSSWGSDIKLITLRCEIYLAGLKTMKNGGEKQVQCMRCLWCGFPENLGKRILHKWKIIHHYLFYAIWQRTLETFTRIKTERRIPEGMCWKNVLGLKSLNFRFDILFVDPPLGRFVKIFCKPYSCIKMFVASYQTFQCKKFHSMQCIMFTWEWF